MILPVFSYGRSSPKAGRHWMTDFSSKRLAETKVSRLDSEHLLATHPSSRVGSAATPLPLLDFFVAIRKSTERFTRIHWLNPKGICKQEKARNFRFGSLRARTDLNSTKWRMAAGGVKPSLPYYFIIVTVAKR